MNESRSELWTKNHDFVPDTRASEARTAAVLVLTAITMAAEIAAGYIWGSVALLADGWHMGTHVSAFMITFAAYYFARSRKDDIRYSYGTGKISVLGGYTSAIVLAGVSFFIAFESVQRFFSPQEIFFNESLIVAFTGLAVNLISALLLGWGEHHHSHEEHDHTHHTDHNLKAAYYHVLADALTSVLAIAALFTGMYTGWTWPDPVTGLIGSLIILRWSYSLIRETVPILTDGSADKEIMEVIRQRLETCEGTVVTDFHMWRISAAHYSVQVSLVADNPEPVENYYKLLKGIPCIDHLAVEVFRRGG